MKNTMIALRLFLVMSVLTGVVYPLLITGVAQAIWPSKAGGSLVTINNDVKGSLLIAQKFGKETYFWPRPSAADYNAAASSGSNKGPTNADLKKSFDEGKSKGLPNELIFASASGLDPHVSPATVLFQLERVSLARNFSIMQKTELTKLVEASIEDRDLGFLGEPRINILKLNLELDRRFP